MKRTRNRIGSLLLSVCMVFTMLPAVTFAAEGGQETGTLSSTGEITVNEPVTPLLRGAGIQALGTGNNITNKFIDDNFLAEVRKVLNKGESDPIYDTDVASVNNLFIGNNNITSLAGIEYFTKLNQLICPNNQLTALDVSRNTKLTKLNCDNNQLTALDVSHNTMLTDLNCKNNQLIALDMSKNTALQILNCNYNQLTQLGVSSNTELTALNCYDNQLTELDVSKSTKLGVLKCNNNQLTALDVSKNTMLITLDCSYNCIPKRSAVMGLDTRLTTKFTFDPQNSGTPTSNDITTIFKDANFLAEVRTVLKRGKNDRIYDTDDFAPVKYLSLRNKNIKSLEGIEYFTELTTLACSGNQLTELDVSKNTKLEILDCSTNQLTALDASSNTELTNLNCYNNQLTALNVSSNTELTNLNCYNNQLTALDVSKNTKLENLNCYNNQLTTLDVSDNAALSDLNCHTNQLATLDVSDNAALSDLNCHTNQLTTLDVSRNTALDLLDCSNNQLTALDVRNNTALTLLYCNYNLGLTALEVSNNTMLIELSCSYTGLTALDVSNNTALTRLGCSYTGLTALDVNNNTVLIELSCNSNQLSALDVSNNTALSNLWCYGNQLTALDVSKNTALTTLNCSGNYMPDESVITGLDTSLTINLIFNPQNSTRNDITTNFKDANFLAIVRLMLSKNESDPIYDTDNFASVTILILDDKNIASLEGIEYFTDLTRLNCTRNQLSALDVSKNTKLTELYCSGNQLTTLDVSQNTALTTLNCSGNYMPDDSVITGLDKNLTTNFTFDPQNSSTSTYAVTVNSGTASSTTAVAKAIVTIVADTAPGGKRFKEWTVIGGGIALTNAQATSTTFTMPANAVIITATYEDIPAGVTPVTGVTLNKNNVFLYSNTSPNTDTLTTTVAPSSATDKSVTWQSSNTNVATVDASGNIKATGNGTATITVTTTDGDYTASCTVTVSTYTSGGDSPSGGSSDDNSSSGDNSTNTATVTQNQPNQPVTAVAPITATAGTNGAASASIPDNSISDAINKAQADAKAQGKTTNGVSVALNVTMPKEATALTATLSRNALNSLVSAGVTNLEINGSPVSVTFDQKALTEIQGKSSGNIDITIAPNTNLSETAKKMIGTRPVYNITVNYGNNSTVSSFGGGVATVAIPYTPANGEAISGLHAVYVDENGNATRVDGSTYDANSGCLTFTTTHFLQYGIGYTAPGAKYTDISAHWAKESIDYVVGRGLLTGTSETTFLPNAAMTRGMLVTALGRLAGVDTQAYTTNNFTDIKTDSAYRLYIEWAYSKGIVQGIGNNQFAPDRAITREEIAVIIGNFTKATGYTLPVKCETTTYADASGIGNYYETAATAMQQAGIMTGGTDNRFYPKSNATRAEVSSILHRYIKLTIDPDTAQGWALNDAGQWLYYKEGKVLTSTQTIDGMKYFFHSNGVLQTGWVKDGDNWRYYSGNIAIVGWHDISANGNNKKYYFNKDGIMTSD